jgi:16S rRNA (uracil1498-N3)-methyltransferase
MPRIFIDSPLSVGHELVLKGASARHIQVLRMQPEEEVTLFNGEGGEYQAVIERMGRSDVALHVSTYVEREAEAAVQVHLLVGAPANERMDWLVEKAAELGAASIRPVLTERSVMRLAGDRAEKKAAHWQAVVQAACEQCGRNRVPVVHPMKTLREVLAEIQASTQDSPVFKRVLSLQAKGDEWNELANAPANSQIWLLNGPEGGLSPQEESYAIEQGFAPAGLGPRILRAETAALAALMRALGPRA